MKMAPECPDCLVGRVQYVADLLGSDRGPEAAAAAQAYVEAEYRPGETANIPTASQVHRLTNAILGHDDPWATLKQRSNEVALALLPRARELVAAVCAPTRDTRTGLQPALLAYASRSSQAPLSKPALLGQTDPDPLRAAVTAAIVGNSFDFGIKGRESFDPESLAVQFESLMSEGLGVDDTPRLKALLEQGGEVLYCADNCGEIVFDMLLMEQLRAYPVKITLLVKGGPVLSDATRADAAAVGADKLADEVLDTTTDHVGCWLPESDPELTRRVAKADLIIAKGMGHYEAFSEWDYRPIAYLLRSKCWPVSRALGVAKDLNVCRVVE